MLGPRRFLPSLSLLAAFEAAARTGSITTAAKEVNLTQGAVSRQIKALEDTLNVQLFVRDRQTIRLTPAGESYAREIRGALLKIRTASLHLRANPHGGTLTVAMLPGFSERWLIPRLPTFFAAHPAITLNLMTRISPVDFRAEAFDAAVSFGNADWNGVQMALLRSERVVPMCSPEMKSTRGFGKVADLLAAPLLHLTTRPDAWEKWFRFNGEPTEYLHGMLFDQFTTIAQAAIASLGVALLPTFLFAEELASGKLVQALPLPMLSDERYFVVWPPDRAAYAPLVSFRDWLLQEGAIPD